MAAFTQFSITPEESRDAMATSGDECSMTSDIFQSIQDVSTIRTPPSALVESSRNSSRTSFEMAISDSFREISASSLLEYAWPPNSITDRYFIQEQLAVYLDVKSFKRKYPELSRRQIVDIEERNYLLQNEVVTPTQLNMGLSALRVEDVYDLLTNDYPEKFEEYKKVIAERNKQALAVKQMELRAVKSDSKRLEEWRKKAMRSAVDWNSELNRDRARDRKCYFDSQTMLIQEPVRDTNRPAATAFGTYPTAILPGQYQDYYKKYTEEELYQLPVNGVLQAEKYIPFKRSLSPDSIVVKPEELLQAEAEELKRKKEMDAKPKQISATGRVSAEETRGEETGESCAFCQGDIYQNDRFVQCSKCGSCGHPQCMDMTDDIYYVVKTYNWMCMECKPCSICSKLDEEDKMLFCDRCDRGYHTFCVGLSELPSGRWVCPKFCFVHEKAAKAAVAAVIATPSTFKPSLALDETVEAVAQAVLASISKGTVSSSSSLLSSSKSVSSSSNSPQPPPTEPRPTKRRRQPIARVRTCIRCGGPSGTNRRRILLCNNCISAASNIDQSNGQQAVIGEDKKFG